MVFTNLIGYGSLQLHTYTYLSPLYFTEITKTSEAAVYVTRRNGNRKAKTDNCRGSTQPGASGEDIPGAGAETLSARMRKVRTRIFRQKA